MFRFVLLLALLVAIAPNVSAQENGGAAPDTLAMVSLPPELDRVLRDYEEGGRASDADALAALFTQDGFILRTGRPPVRSREAIAEAYRNAGGPLHLHAFSYAQADSVAYIIGGYRGFPGTPDAGKFILTLQLLSDGVWYISADMDNLNR